jgi:hypothetical protein
MHLEILPSGAYLICGEKDADGLYDMRAVAVSVNGSHDDDVDYEAFHFLTVCVAERTLRYNGWQLSQEDFSWYGEKDGHAERAEFIEDLLEALDAVDFINSTHEA